MDLEVIVSLAEARKRRQASARAEEIKNQFDPEEIALALCRDLASVGDGQAPWILLAGIARRTRIPEEELVVGAAYAHVCGWVIYSTYSVMLTEGGRALLYRGRLRSLGPPREWPTNRAH